METDQPLDRLAHDEIREWLGRALQGLESLPPAEPGEPPHLAVGRLSKGVKPMTRESLRDGCIALVRRFGEDGSGDPASLKELLRLATLFKTLEVIPTLADLARRFPSMNLPAEVRLAVLATIVDIAPPQSPAFWREVLAQDPRLHAGRALSGMLATDHAEAIKLLAELPDDESLARAMARKVDFAWTEMTLRQRGPFVEGIRDVLESCSPRLAAALRAWVDAKKRTNVAITPPGSKNDLLMAAIKGVLGKNFAPRFTETKLVPGDKRRVA